MAGAFERRVYNRGGSAVMSPEEAEGAQNLAWGLTGIPLMQEGYADVQGAFGEEGAWTDAPIGIGKMAMGALPYGGALTRAALATLPRAATVLGAGGFATGMTGEAEAARRKADAPPEPEPAPVAAVPMAPTEPPKQTIYELAAERDPRAKLALDAYRAAILQNDADMARLSDAYKKEANRGKAGPLAADIQRQIGEAQGAAAERLAPLQEKLDAAVEPYLPFDQRFPGLSQVWTGVQLGAPALAAVATRGAGRAILNAPRKALNKTVAQAEKALDKGKVGVADRKIAEATRRANRYGDAPPTAGGNFMTDYALPITAGAGLGAELSMLPEQYNKRNTLPGTTDNDLATTRLSPENIGWTALPGALMGGLGGLSASHFVPGRTILPNVEGAKALGALAGPEAGGAAGYLMKSKESERALQALDNAPLPPPRLPPPEAELVPASAFARAEPEVFGPRLSERLQFNQRAIGAPTEAPMPFGPSQSWPPQWQSSSVGELVPAASRSVVPRETAKAPARALTAEATPAQVVDLSKTKARTRTWEKAFSRAEASKTKDEAIAAIRDLKPDTGFDPKRAGVAKRRMIKTIKDSDGKRGRDWRKALEDLRTDLKSKGLYGASAATIGVSAATRKPEDN